MRKAIAIIIAVAAVVLISFFVPSFIGVVNKLKPPKAGESISSSPSVSSSVWIAPISNAFERITKKPFGIYVSPGNSPISPERFTGYHTGIDFETFPEEQNIDVPIYAVCNGRLIYKNWVSGYGGVAVESCALNGKPVTVLYGHLKESGIALTVGSELTAGQKIGVLGKGYSVETDGERKHLHLAVHMGTAVDLEGYVQNKSDLNFWRDFATFNF